MAHHSLCGSFPSFWFSVHQGGVDFLFICSSVLSITKPSTVLQWPQHCINPLSASQSVIHHPTVYHVRSIICPSVSYCPCSEMISSESPTGESHRVEGTAGQEEIRGKCRNRRWEREKRLYPVLSSLSLSQPACCWKRLLHVTTCLLAVVFVSL